MLGRSVVVAAFALGAAAAVAWADPPPERPHPENALSVSDRVLRAGCALDDASARCGRYLAYTGRLLVIPMSVARHSAEHVGPAIIVDSTRHVVAALGFTARF